ncbi:MAG TPA: hypothetical protein DCZ12_13200 [Gammaproteobacteria bacterium]|nr:hypothetical protein [Gammaproteobacteria bacterium]
MLNYFAAAKWVLRGSGLSESTLHRVAKAVESQKSSAVSASLNDQDFHWPWFDECLELFQNSNHWPDLPAWSWFESEPELLNKKEEVLLKLNLKVLKNIARRFQIDIPPRSRVAEIRKLIAQAASSEQLEPYRTILNNRITANDKEKQLEAKFKLLEIAIRSKEYHLLRHEQLSELVESTGKPVAVCWMDDLSREMAGDYQFNSNKKNDGPPFYPGDSTYLKLSM